MAYLMHSASSEVAGKSEAPNGDESSDSPTEQCTVNIVPNIPIFLRWIILFLHRRFTLSELSSGIWCLLGAHTRPGGQWWASDWNPEDVADTGSRFKLRISKTEHWSRNSSRNWSGSERENAPNGEPGRESEGDSRVTMQAAVAKVKFVFTKKFKIKVHLFFAKIVLKFVYHRL